jgi:N-methylhydantoinase A
MRLDLDAARRAIDVHVASPLGIPVIEAALRIHDIVNENMANASRVQAVERGHDPTGYSLVAFGGAGPVHAWGVARRLRLGTVIVPPSAGLGSAVGLLLAPRTYRIARTRIGTLDVLDWAEIERMFTEMTSEAEAVLHDAGVPSDLMRCSRSVDMRYLGQRKELTVAVPGSDLTTRGSRTLRTAFEAEYARIYHRTHDGHPVEALAWRLTASGPPIQQPARASRSNGRVRAAKPRDRRAMRFPDSTGSFPVLSRYDLSAGMTVRGPAVIEEAEATTVIGPRGSAIVDGFGNLVITLPQARTR